MSTIVPPASPAQVAPARWTPEGVAFLRRVMAGEVYTGLSGQALALWVVGIDDQPRDYPRDRADFARCMNVYWSAPESLRSKMRSQLRAWNDDLREWAEGVPGWMWEPVNFETPTYYGPFRHREVRL